MRLVIGLGGNALLRRGEPLSNEAQRANVKRAAAALAPVARSHQVIITHGNGPQVGLLALQTAAYAGPGFPLDVLDAETEGMIGYLIEQELGNVLGPAHPVAALLTQIEVDRRDPAFRNPTKPIGPLYDRQEAERLARERGWAIAADGARYRRVVPSPAPLALVEARTIELLVKAGVTVICAGGGGIPVIRTPAGSLTGIEAVIDKDQASALTARVLGAEGLVLLTDVAAVEIDHRTPHARPIRRANPAALAALSFEAGTMAPKVEAACAFVNETGGFAAIGALAALGRILDGEAGTLVRLDVKGLDVGPAGVGLRLQ